MKEVKIYKVIFELVHGGYAIEYLDQERIDVYVEVGRVIIFQEHVETVWVN